MERHWLLKETPEDGFFERFPELPPMVATLLFHRDLRTQSQVDEFLNPDYGEDIHDPYLFKDMQTAVDRIFAAIDKKEKITVHGDYDADGVSGSVLLYQAIKALGHDSVDVFLPHREIDGYGLNTHTVDTLHAEGTSLLITCDCGVSNTAEVARANEVGMDVIITDHHSVPENKPEAFAIIHPKVPDEPYPDKTLAGGAVAFKLLQALMIEHKKNNDVLANGMTHEVFEKWSLDMAAIASVADMVPLLGESRTLTKYGLIVLNKTKRIGLQKLLLNAKILQRNGKLTKPITSESISFYIAPRINAAGRMNHASTAFKLLVAENPEEATELAKMVEDENAERQKMTKVLIEQAQEQVLPQIDQPLYVVHGKGWATGLVGLVASKLKEQYQKPCVVIAENENIMGSGRSVDGFNMVEALQTHPELFEKFGGHPMACGFTLAADKSIKDFTKAMLAEYTTQTAGETLIPTLHIDAEIKLDAANWELLELLEQFKPFGQYNPKPKFVSRGCTITDLQCMGSNDEHIRLTVMQEGSDELKAVWWRAFTKHKAIAEQLDCDKNVDIVYEIEVNEWKHKRNLQLHIIDIRLV